MNVLTKAIKLVLCAVLFLMLAPLPLLLPSSDLDLSWMFSLMEANRAGLRWGHHISFTYGPTHYIISKAFHPIEHRMELILVMIWTICALSCLYTYCSKLKYPTFSLSCLVLMLLVVSNGENSEISRYILFLREAIILFVLFVAFLNLLQNNSLKGLLINISVLAFAVTTKGSIGILGFFLLLVLLTKAFNSRSISMFFYYLVAYLAIISLIWVGSAQHIFDLIPYVLSILDYSRHYGDAMSLWGNKFQIPVALALMFILSIHCVIYNQKDSYYKLAGLLVFLFFNFKFSFVRHDSHYYILILSVLFLSVLNLLEKFNWYNMSVFILSSGTLIYVNLYIHKYHFPAIKEYLTSQFNTVEHKFSSLIDFPRNEGSQFSEIYNRRFELIQATYRIPSIVNSATTNSFRQMELFANHIPYQPLPSLQGYAMLSSYLLDKNLNWLSANPPENFLLTLETIDNRYPGMDLSILLPSILSGYQYVPNWQVQSLFLLQKRHQEVSSQEVFRLISSLEITLNDTVTLPQIDTILFAKIKLQRSFISKIVNLLFKNNHLIIEVKLKDGRVYRHRLIPNNAEAGFIISPYLGFHNSVQELFSLYENDNGQKLASSVSEIKVLEIADINFSWDPQATLEIYCINSYSRRNCLNTDQVE